MGARGKFQALGLFAALAVGVYAAGGTEIAPVQSRRQEAAKNAVNNIRALLDQMEEAGGVRFGDGIRGSRPPSDTSRDTRERRIPATLRHRERAATRRDVKDLVSRAQQEATRMAAGFRRERDKENRQRARNLLDSLKKLGKIAENLPKDLDPDKKPKAHWRFHTALADARETLERIPRHNPEWTNPRGSDPGRSASARPARRARSNRSSVRPSPARRNLDTIQSLVNEMAALERVVRVSETKKTRAQSVKRMRKLAAQMAGEAQAVVKLYRKRKDKRRVELSRRLVQRAERLRKAAKQVPEKRSPKKDRRALADLRGALEEVLDGHPDEIDILAWT